MKPVTAGEKVNPKLHIYLSISSIPKHRALMNKARKSGTVNFPLIFLQ